MFTRKIHDSVSAFILLLGLAATAFLGNIVFLATPVLAAIEKPAPPKARKIVFRLPSKGAPGNRSDAASRDSCPTSSVPLTAFIPANNAGYTISGNPTFLFYIPHKQIKGSSLKFEIQVDKKISQKYSLNTVIAPGIVRMEFPASFDRLETGKRYRWKLSYICNESAQNSPIVLEGAIERIKLSEDAQAKLKNVKSLEDKAILYAEYGVWFDLIELLTDSPASLSRADIELKGQLWRDLFDQSPEIDLSTFSNFSLFVK
jgi:Domain of Unknown Function (DUF928)